MRADDSGSSDSASAAAAPSGGTRAQRRLEVRDALAAAAMALFDERGFDAVSVEEIAARGGVSRRTFFRYFPNKEAAFFWPQQARIEAFAAAMARRRSGARPLDGVRQAALAMADRYEQERERALREHALTLASTTLHAFDAQLDPRWEQALREAMLADGCDPLDARVGAGALLGVMRAMFRAWFDSAGAFDLRVRGAEALERLSPLLDAIAGRCAHPADEAAAKRP